MEESRMKILCIGMMVCDNLISPVPPDILELDSVRIDKPVVTCGGDALNVAIGLAKLNCKVAISGWIGDDMNGRFLLRQCQSYSVDTTAIMVDREYGTAISYALIDQHGERHFLSEKAIFAKLTGSDITDQMINQAEYIYIGSAMAMREMDRGGIADVFTRAHQMGKVTVMDAAINREDPERNWLNDLAPAFRETDFFFPSMEEAAKITGKIEPEKIAGCFQAFGMKGFGIKLGARGCFVTDFKTSRYIRPPKNMPVVDTTGAGDSFLAGLISALSKGWDLYEASAFAGCVATTNVGYTGGTSGIMNFEDSLRFYQTCKKV